MEDAAFKWTKTPQNSPPGTSAVVVPKSTEQRHGPTEPFEPGRFNGRPDRSVLELEVRVNVIQTRGHPLTHPLREPLLEHPRILCFSRTLALHVSISSFTTNTEIYP